MGNQEEGSPLVKGRQSWDQPNEQKKEEVTMKKKNDRAGAYRWVRDVAGTASGKVRKSSPVKAHWSRFSSERH
jgi:hypothetical protein